MPGGVGHIQRPGSPTCGEPRPDPTSVPGTGCRPSGRTCRVSDAAALRRAATVVRLRRHVLDRADLEAGRLERADRGLAARTRALDEDVDLLHAVLLRTARGSL